MRRVLRYPHPVLKLQAAEVVPGKLCDEIVKQLIHTASNLKWGKVAGLAAPQIGYSSRIFVIGPEAFINPVIKEESGIFDAEEGCYSLMPGKFDYDVKRPAFLTLTWQDVNGNSHTEKFEGQKAQIISHEVDHLNGILCVNQGVSDDYDD